MLLQVNTLLALTCLLGHAQGEGSCSAAKKCCDGKDTDCGVTDWDPDTLRTSTCFCDQGCLEMGDCCYDFKHYCGVIDCKTSEWSAWSECDATCGRGTSQRTRDIIHPPANGGKECGSLEQKKRCQSEVECKRQNRETTSAAGETAMLLPGKYSSKRVKEYDVRHNLESFVEEDYSDSEYCVVFRVDKAMKGCRHNADTRSIFTGNDICVSCEGKAFRDHLGNRCVGHGVEGRITRFKNLITPGCHGRWEKMRTERDCSSCKPSATFIFV